MKNIVLTKEEMEALVRIVRLAEQSISDNKAKFILTQNENGMFEKMDVERVITVMQGIMDRIEIREEQTNE